ncbi:MULTISPECIES: hypothetical protein [Streptomyces]|uniref:Uncharacterized protein n=1 Tax=Streptomyces chartreusis NRRL 3882 TaxID=1079985 RepID=A0A2N9AZW0_STRCX|nr:MULTISPECIES: hypothetical protein [Streptomyces]MYS95585.1 hypothetical protein [Streptomyces sp. SID5464]SOR76616.1 hypothetical protein SCNRRL3882_0099 [Streptomyces chartreusis NRRL 3882]
MTLTRVMVALSPGIPVAAEILDTESGNVRSAVVVSGRPFETELPPGTYVVRLAPPGLERVSATVVVPPEGPAALTVDFVLDDPHPSPGSGQAVPTDRPVNPSPLKRLLLPGTRRKAALPPDEALHTARELRGTGLFVCDTDGTLLRPIEVADEYVVSRPASGEGRSTYLCVTQGQDHLARFVSLPANCVGRIRSPAQPDGGEGDVTVRPADPDARALLDYRAQGRLGAAAAITDHVVRSIGARIEAGRGDPAAGCAVAYHLMDHPDRDRARQWVRLMADAFPSSDDVSLLADWFLLEKDGPVPRDARERLITAAEAGEDLPVYLAGLRLLRTALERLSRSDRASGQWDPRLTSATHTVNTYLLAADPANPFVSYTGTGLHTPLVAEDAPAVRSATSVASDDADSAGVLAKALDLLGTVTAGLTRTISLPLLTLTWSDRPDGGGQMLSVDSHGRAKALAGMGVVLVGAEGWRMEVARLSDAGTATFSLTGSATAKLVTPEPAEPEDAVVLPPPVLQHAAASGPEQDHRVVTPQLEFLLEPVRGADRWRLTARSRVPESSAGWVLVGQRSAADRPYKTFALPLAGEDAELGAEPTVLLGKASAPLDWYMVPEPVDELPAAGRKAILRRSLARAADSWTREAIQKVLTAPTAEEG